ncbi:hypothetical protein BX661DRAFT_185341 [Kickxella alabastrina]|uniref:uncharacterized protein n=1 Tax=Kickxella alabastrina TaxID=61397 RepID=UPI0022207F16|nr:uncharacterized protein BX661DRAFT_185341 [Kickxella alabastrina]KAI7824445.1 hypothetical protein BX661DRAFT_185341 [Kickxella alabastrina]
MQTGAQKRSQGVFFSLSLSIISPLFWLLAALRCVVCCAYTSFFALFIFHQHQTSTTSINNKQKIVLFLFLQLLLLIFTFLFFCSFHSFIHSFIHILQKPWLALKANTAN